MDGLFGIKVRRGLGRIGVAWMSYVVTTGSERVHVYVTVWALALDCLGWGVVMVG